MAERERGRERQRKRERKIEERERERREERTIDNYVPEQEMDFPIRTNLEWVSFSDVK